MGRSMDFNDCCNIAIALKTPTPPANKQRKLVLTPDYVRNELKSSDFGVLEPINRR